METFTVQTAKYYDRLNKRPLDMDADGCALEDWPRLYGKARFARHPRGFHVFVPPDAIAASNEYAEADPYSVENNIAGEFHARRIDLTVALLREAALEMQSPCRVLDLGCGQGHITEKMRQALVNGEFTGLDFSVSAIQYAHEHFPQIDFDVADACDCPYADEYYDVVVCNNLWEHVPDPLRLLAGIKRMLKPGGFLVLSTPSRYRVSNLIRILRGKTVAFMSSYHVTEYTVGQVKEQLAYGGLDVRRVLTRPISTATAKSRAARWVFASFVALVRSHHQLEATVFYLAQKPFAEAD